MYSADVGLSLLDLSVRSHWCIVLFKSSISLLVFCLVALTVIERKVLKSPTILFIYLFNWGVADLQCCVISAVQQSDADTYIFYIMYIIYVYILFNILFHCGLSQDFEYSFLCCTVGPCFPFILYVIVCIY